jgi:hypothetical protein
MNVPDARAHIDPGGVGADAAAACTSAFFALA